MKLFKYIRDEDKRLTKVGWYHLGVLVGLYNGVVFTLLVQVWNNG